jgi:hypothetical protein
MSMRSVIALALIGAMALPHVAWARQAPPDGQPPATFDLPISIDRIQRQLKETPPSTKPSALHLEFHVDVYGKSPAIDLFQGIDLKAAPVRYGGMTHQEFLDQVTPREFRTPGASLPALLAWMAIQLAKKAGSKDAGGNK